MKLVGENDKGDRSVNGAVRRRKEFFAQLALLTNDALHSTRQHGLILFDIDAFRFVNASSGYPAGDYLIRLLEEHLMVSVPYGHICANLGAGSFAILAPNTELSDITELESTIRQSVREREFRWQDHSFHITLSAGVTLLLDSDNDESVPFSRAELALFQAKAQGSDSVKFGQAPAPAGKVVVSSWSPKIHHAFLHDGFQLWLQPVVDVVSGETVFVDVTYTLNADGEQVPLEAFKDEIIAMGMAVTLDRWLIRKLRDYLLSAAGAEYTRFVFRLSPASVKSLEFSKFLKAELGSHPALCSSLGLGLPFRGARADFEGLREFSESFRDVGLPILLDEFGEGVDSLLQLASFTADYVRPAARWFSGSGGSHSEMASVLAKLIRASEKQAIGLGADSASAVENLNQQGFTLVQGALYPAVRC